MSNFTKISVFFLLFLTGCDWKDFIPVYGWFPEHESSRVIHREQIVSGKLTVALGGSFSNEYIFLDSQDVTDVQHNPDDDALFSISPRNGFTTIAEGHGFKVTPLQEGIGYVRPITNSGLLDAIEITIPPQKLIQILVGEARGEIAREATLENDHVKSTSVSVTGDAVGAVIRNRIRLINENLNPHLFVADPSDYYFNPDISYYDAVIEARHGDAYQFLPVDPEDSSHEEYIQASARLRLSSALEKSYDQAILTAGGIFNGSTEDPTSGSFGFYSPSEEEFRVLRNALGNPENVGGQLPEGCGTSDSHFPALAPIQVKLLPEVAPSGINPDVPSFVFIRSRMSTEAAVTGEW